MSPLQVMQALDAVLTAMEHPNTYHIRRQPEIMAVNKIVDDYFNALENASELSEEQFLEKNNFQQLCVMRELAKHPELYQ